MREDSPGQEMGRAGDNHSHGRMGGRCQASPATAAGRLRSRVLLHQTLRLLPCVQSLTGITTSCCGSGAAGLKRKRVSCPAAGTGTWTCSAPARAGSAAGCLAFSFR